MAAPSIDSEFSRYWSLLTPVQKESLLSVIRSFVIPRERITLEDYNKEIDEAIANVIASSSFITGPDVTKFEVEFAKYVGAEDCASTGSGTTALICALRALGIGKGDEVITTPHTFVATTEIPTMPA
jgi:dTDP-4-amino-4,6-dideoxygalactose transaminase